MSSPPSVAIDAGEELVFWQGPASQLTEAWWGGSPWTVPADISAAGPLN
jgi:hypothetical protein